MAIKIGRREFITLLGGAEVAWLRIVRAEQPTGRMPHIALLSVQSPTTLEPRHIEQFKVGLLENGLVEGQNITVDYFWGEGSTERLLQLATELAQRNLDVIVTSGAARSCHGFAGCCRCRSADAIGLPSCAASVQIGS